MSTRQTPILPQPASTYQLLLAWAADAIGEPAAWPKRIYPIDTIPVTTVGKQFKPALAADAAVRAVARPPDHREVTRRR